MRSGVKVQKDRSVSVIIAGAGSATRFKQNKVKSKQFLCLSKRPLLFYCLEKFSLMKEVLEIIVVSNDIQSTKELLKTIDFPCSMDIKITAGGKQRQDSVYNGFCTVSPLADLVLIHDVARPLFNIKDASKCIEKAYISGAAVLAAQIIDTVKKVKSYNDELLIENTLNREELYTVQTPQVFSYGLLDRAYKMYMNSDSSLIQFTDEAAMIELLEKPVNLIIGSRKNIKITYPEDLEIASFILEQLESEEDKKLNKECLIK